MSALRIINRGSGSATHKVEAAREVMDPYSREHYKKNYEGMDAILRGEKIPSAMGGGRYNPIDSGVIQDVVQYRKDMNTNKRHHEKGQPIKLTPDVKNALWKKALNLKQQITVGMIPQDEIHPVRVAQRIIDGKAKVVSVVDEQKMMRTRVVERNKTWYKANRENLREFKRIMRVLEPEDKDITSITESWRPRTRVVKKGGK